MSFQRRLRATFLPLALASATLGGTAFADDKRARAQQLFDSALADAEHGDFAHACPKFLASQEADPKTSTLLNLGNCYEKNGQTASAWGAFREAEGMAQKAGRADWSAAAHARAEALEPKLLRLTIDVSDAAKVPGLVVTRDGARLSPAELGIAIPVDPGDHVVAASADGYISVEKHVAVSEASTTFPLPVLEKLPAPAPEARHVAFTPFRLPKAKVEKTHWSTMEIGGVAVVSAGVLTMASAGILALVASGNYDEAKGHCTDGATHGCDPAAVRTANRAYETANLATAVMVTGIVLTAAGAALVFFAPDEKKLAKATTGVFTW